MGVIVKKKSENEAKIDNIEYNEFVEELRKGYYYWEIEKKIKQLTDYINAYNEIQNKTSFNAQYLKTLIDILKVEIIE
jgi:hypothetical protein